MYTYIIGLDDELWNILEDKTNIKFNGVRMVTDRKTVTPAQKKIYRKHHRVKGILSTSISLISQLLRLSLSHCVLLMKQTNN